MTDGPLRVEHDERGVTTLTLDRPRAANALDVALMDRLTEVFEGLSEDDRGSDTRVVVLTGAGRTFCAGADLGWLRDAAGASFTDTIADSRRLEAVLRAVDACPRPVVARINGPALGGGLGLVACADVAVAVHAARFGFSEVRLGLAPAVISPYVVASIGLSHSRHLMLTGERFDTDVAVRIGLVHRVVRADRLDAAVDAVVDELLAGGPAAQAETKRLLRRVAETRSPAEAGEHTVRAIARLRTSPEAQEGMAAFFDGRHPGWRAG